MKTPRNNSPAPQHRIERRDFLHGIAAAAGLMLMPREDKAAATAPASAEYFLARGILESDPRYYPPALTGMRGSHPGSFEMAHQMRDQGVYQGDTPVQELPEHYDLAVVGAGISGLAAAWFYREKQPDAKILILDNHDDFGGHAKRNEFRSGDRLLIGYGGTQNIELLSSRYGPESLHLLKALGIEPRKFEDYFDAGFKKRFGLSHCIFFDKETFGSDRLVADEGRPDWPAYLEKTPLSVNARADLRRIQVETIDYLPGLSRAEKTHLLLHMSFKEFLVNYAKVDPQVLAYFQKTTHGSYCAGIDAISAFAAITQGLKAADQEFLGGPTPALATGLGLVGQPFYDEPYIYHFPDGNASIARMLVRSLIPGSAPGSTMEDIVTARFNYGQLDNPDAGTRLRLNSTAVRVINEGGPGSPSGTELTYLRQGRPYKVKAKNCVLACWNGVIPHLCPEMPADQKQGLAYGVKAPITYTNVQIRNWRAIQKAGLGTSFCPGSYFSEVYLDWPVSIGGYRYAKSPDEPAILHLVRVPTAPGLPIRDQYRAGRAELLATPFETFEHHIHDQLGRMFGPFGFRSHRDIQAITVNRWPHGYAYSYQPLWDGEEADSIRPNMIGRQRFGRIAIANSDSGASAETPVAIEQAFRAINELSEST